MTGQQQAAGEQNDVSMHESDPSPEEAAVLRCFA
jgi:hypothetical protein